MGKLSPPAPLSNNDDLSEFFSGEEQLDYWLKRRALKNEVTGASRTYVVCNQKRVVAYYTIATGSVMQIESPGKIKRNMPDPIPVIILGRLAIDKDWQGKGLGAGLLKDALLRASEISQQVGVRALLVQAISESAKAFYLHHGFMVSPIDEMKLLMPL